MKGNAKKKKAKGGWRVVTYDNFHFMDEDEGGDEAGRFATYAEALAEAQRIVDRSLRWERQQCRDPMDPVELYGQYTDFGEDPSIVPGHPRKRFSAWDYARERAKEICAEPMPKGRRRRGKA